ncbi:hypothetical protein, partial [Akkermansia sp.]|uniref:hypothetical protein n=1 Tax=Akkermansia sp. TaxID=1872421 RepID=UPI003AAF7D22
AKQMMFEFKHGKMIGGYSGKASLECRRPGKDQNHVSPQSEFLSGEILRGQRKPDRIRPCACS